jgi:hypothetical protein
MTNDELSHAITLGILGIALSFWPVSADAGQGPSLLANGDFDTATTGWTINTGFADSMSWSTADASGSPHSGSARLTVGPQSVLIMGEPCLTVEAGESYVLSGSVLVDEATPGASVLFGFADFEDAACTGAMGFGLQFSNFAQAELETDRWQALAAGTFESDETRFMRPALWVEAAAGDVSAYFDGLHVRRGECVPGRTTLCLNEGRFEVTAFWQTIDGMSDQGRAVPFAADSGSFWFFSDTNLELDVKVLNGCAINQHYWVFAAGLTNVEVYLQVRDTETETYWTNDNPQGRTFVTVTDTEAFAVCP